MKDATVKSETLSDGSVAYSVIVYFDDARAEFACTSIEHARALCEQLNMCAWYEIDV